MKKIWLSVLGVAVVLVVAFYFIFGNGSNTAAPVAANTNANSGAGAADNATGSDASAGTTTAASGTSAGGAVDGAPAGQYNDGAYTGPVADAIYGKLQLVVTIAGGKITDITWPVYPDSPGHTSEVSASALPALEQEAIASQSANVNIVSGATQDSQAFQQSLAAALAQAKS